MKIQKVIFTLCICISFFSTLFAREEPQNPNGSSFINVAVYFKLNKVGPGETFRFQVKSKSGSPVSEAIANESNYLGTVVTARVFLPGDTIIITQLEGPRVCNLQPYYVIPTTAKKNMVVTLSCGEPAPPPPPPPSVPVYFKLNKVGPGENFIFTVSRTKIFVYTNAIVSESNYLTNVATSPIFKPGDTVNITLSLGPRPCNLQPYYVIPTEPGQGLVVNLNCGEPPPPPPSVPVYFKLNKIGPGEFFSFTVTSPNRFGYTNAIVSATNYLTNVATSPIFKPGDTVNITLSLGPRPCNLQPYYIIPKVAGQNLVVNLDCGEPPPPPPSVPVYFKLNKVGPGENFIFTVSRTKMFVYTKAFVSESNYLSNVATSPVFKPGDTVNITLSQGPRPCNLQPYYVIPTVAGQNLVVNLNCGEPPPPPPPVSVYFKLNKVGPGETFTFTVQSPNNTLFTRTFVSESNYLTNVATSPIFKPGDTVNIHQSPGTRPCNLQPYYVIPTVAGEKLVVNLNCGEPPPPPPPPVSVYFKLNKVGPGETFTFTVQSPNNSLFTRAFVSESNYLTNVATSPIFKPGDTVNIHQSPGTRPCNLQPYYVIPTVAGEKLVVNLNCGEPPPPPPPPVSVYFKLNKVGPGETFTFTVQSPNNTLFTRAFVSESNYLTNVATSPIFKPGDTVNIHQSPGTRPCNLHPYYVIPTATGENLVVNLNCGEPPPPPPPPPPVKTNLAGTFTGPAGSSITIRNEANEELTIAAPANGASGTGFSFPKKYESGAAYSVSITSAPPNFNVAILPAASGVIPVDSSEFNIICSPAIELVSRSSDDKVFSTFYETVTPVVGGKGADEGRYVAFVSNGTGLDGASGKYRQIFLRDMKTGTTQMISRSASGNEGNGDSFAPSISADGSAVAFESYATNLSTGNDNNAVRDVYVWRAGSGITPVSKGAAGFGNAESYEPTISGDGSVIAFSSSASNLTPEVEGTSTVNVFITDGAGQIQLLTKDIKTQKGAGGTAPSISEDGNKVVFSSFSPNLVNNDNNNLWDIFLWQRGVPDLKRISMTASGGEHDQGNESASRRVMASISGNGNYIVYATSATNMVSGDNNKLQDIFICNADGGEVKRISVAANETEGDGDSPVDQGGRIGISYDGNWICYNTSASNLGVPKGNIILQHTRTGKIITLPNSIYNNTGRPMISRYGGFVVAGCSDKLDSRFVSSGIFLFFTGPQVSGK